MVINDNGWITGTLNVSQAVLCINDRIVSLGTILGERNLAQQTLEIVIFGYATHQEAEGALRRQMEDLIRT